MRAEVFNIAINDIKSECYINSLKQESSKN